MKFTFVILALLILSGCANQSALPIAENNSVQPTLIAGNTNSNQDKWAHEEYKVDEMRLKELRLQNEKFKEVPNEFNDVDFRNFKYPLVRLRNGKYDDLNSQKPFDGHQSFSLEDVFYIDLTGDEQKEAVVFLYVVGCGVSCDGGRDIIYFYSSQNGRAKLLDAIETGSNSGGCSLKSFTIKNKKIFVEQFGRRVEGEPVNKDEVFVCKFCTKDETRTAYSIDRNKLKKEFYEVIETPQISVISSPALISISEH